MSLELEVDAGGCRGRFVHHQPGSLPSLGTLARWGLTVAIPASLFFATRAPRQGFLTVAVLVFVAIVVAYSSQRGLGEWFRWESEHHAVPYAFEVRAGVLSVRSTEGTRTAPLADARVTRFADGVQVNPALGKPIQLTWAGATTNDVDRLATLLEAASARRLSERGSRDDIPEHLRDLENLQKGDPTRG